MRTNFQREWPSLLFSSRLILALGGSLSSPASEPPLWKTQIPPPGLEEQKLGALLGRWQHPFRDARPILTGQENTDELWEGQWKLDGHFLAITAAHLPPGQVQNDLELFGHSAQAKSHYMMVITTGGWEEPDEVTVRWFTISGNIWRFAPTQERVGSRIVHHRVAWEFKSPDLMISLTETSTDGRHWSRLKEDEHRRVTGGARGRLTTTAFTNQAATASNAFQEPWRLAPTAPEMAKLRPWIGKWANQHQETDYFVDGTIDSKPIADGCFLGWFETNLNRYSSGKITRNKEVDIWGYSDTAKLYFRLDVTTYDNGPCIPTLVDSDCAWWFGRGNALVLASPIEAKQIGDKTVPSRYGFVVDSPDTMTVFEEHFSDDFRWVDAPLARLQWRRLR